MKDGEKTTNPIKRVASRSLAEVLQIVEGRLVLVLVLVLLKWDLCSLGAGTQREVLMGF